MTWEELIAITGMTGKQVTQNMNYLRSCGDARLVWQLTPKDTRKGVPAWIRVLNEAVEEARL